MELTRGNLGGIINIEREWDIMIYLIVPTITLYDISIELEPPTVKDHDIIYSLIRDLDKKIDNLKKADSVTGFSLLSKSKNNEKFSDLTFLDNNLKGFINLSERLKIPQGTIESLKTVSSDNYINIPIYNRFLILDCENVNTDNYFNEENYEGMLFLKFKHSKTSNALNHEELLQFFDKNNLQYISYVDGTNVPTNIDDHYSSYYISYLYVPNQIDLKFGLDGDDACELEIDDEIICSWYGTHGFSNNPDQHSNTVTLVPGWHKIIVRHQEGSGGDGVRLYIYDSINSTWRLFTNNNIKNYFSGFKLLVPIFKSKQDIIENLFLNPPLVPSDSLLNLIKNSSKIFLKASSENKESLKSISNIKEKINYTINILSGQIEGEGITNLQNCEYLKTTEGISFVKNNLDLPVVEFQLNELTKINSLQFFIAPTFNYTYYDYSDKTIRIEFYSSDDDNSIIENFPGLINQTKSLNIKDFSYENNQYIFKLIDQNQFTLLSINENLSIKKIKIYFEDNIGTFKLFSILRTPINKLKVVDYSNKHSLITEKNDYKGIPFEQLNDILLDRAKIDQQLAYSVDFISFSKEKDSYSFKFINLPLIYTVEF